MPKNKVKRRSFKTIQKRLDTFLKRLDWSGQTAVDQTEIRINPATETISNPQVIRQMRVSRHNLPKRLNREAKRQQNAGNGILLGGMSEWTVSEDSFERRFSRIIHGNLPMLTLLNQFINAINLVPEQCDCSIVGIASSRCLTENGAPYAGVC